MNNQWEVEFDELYPDKLEQTRSHDGTDTGVVVKFDVRGQLKDFIRQTLASQRETLAVSLEEMKRDGVSGGFDGEREMNIEIATYNEAIADAAAHIRKV